MKFQEIYEKLTENKNNQIADLKSISPSLKVKGFNPDENKNYISPKSGSYESGYFFEFLDGEKLEFEIAIKEFESGVVEISTYNYNSGDYESVLTSGIQSAKKFISNNINHIEFKKILKKIN
jgi:hypothetical protein